MTQIHPGIPEYCKVFVLPVSVFVSMEEVLCSFGHCFFVIIKDEFLSYCAVNFQ